MVRKIKRRNCYDSSKHFKKVFFDEPRTIMRLYWPSSRY
ncbi:hypothetical protein SeseC_02316 [Streptococcus equi subsp. zooepidemicus ATCC 35246]|nr:hypothetical protein SeseC_02316 [Streptococcus equi subsp. zooepidemicus ATCC 35246]